MLHRIVPTCAYTDWVLVDLACQAYNKVSVALYDTLGADSVGMSYSHTDALTH